MPSTAEEFNKSRLRSSNITVVISIALVLFITGLIGLLLINAENYSNDIKKMLVVNAFFDDSMEVKDSIAQQKIEAEAFQQIKTLPFVNQATYITRQMAADEAKKGMNIDSKGLFNELIFPSSVEVSLKPEYLAPEKINGVISQLKTIKGVRDVKNNSEMSAGIYKNLDTILKWMLAFSVLFLILTIVIINNSIRLKIFSKRFILKTMQLVGAKKSFIMKPFIKDAIILGIVSSLLSLALLFGLWYYVSSQLNMTMIQEPAKITYLIATILGLGLLISMLSTYAAINRYLKSSVDDLYYS